MGQEPLFLSADAVKLLVWAKNEPDFRDAFSRVARPEQIERLIIGPRVNYYTSARYPFRLYQSWFYAGQWCDRQVYEKLGWDEYQLRDAARELRENGYAGSTGMGYELTDRGWELEVECPEVVVVR